jgi:hypothetical protein
MSKYTTSIEVIINSQSEHQYDIYERIESGRKFLFDFDYQVPDEDFKKSFETQFIEKYFQECIGYETVPLFKMKLKQRLEMLMPEVCFKYNAIQKMIALENPALERSGESLESGTNHSTSDVNGTGSSISKGINSALPASIINANNIGSVTHADSGALTDSSNKSTSSGVSDSTHSIERTFKEYGNQLKGYEEWLNSYRNLMQELLYSFDDMFIQLLF